MHGSHDFPLVVLSILIAICASYTALTLAGRVSVARGKARLAWLLGGSIAMGSGIWSMHFVAMLAYSLPVPIAYSVPEVALSFLAAVGASAFALFVASRTQVSWVRLIAAGFCLGLAVVTMHYTGMAAVRVPLHLGYKPLLVGASVLIAVTASTVALLLFLWLRNDNSRRGRSLRAAAAVVMGHAIAGMHYTAMAAVRFTESASPPEVPAQMLLGASGLAVPVIMGAFVILTLTVAGSITDHWVRARLAAAEALRESEERYRSVLSDIDEVIFRTDAAARWTFLNPAWTQITGRDIETSLGRSFFDQIHPDDRDAGAAHCTPLFDGSADYRSFEVRYLTSDGIFRWVEIHARATRAADGALLGTTGVIRDVSERRRSEQALRAAHEAAEAASRAKSEFLSRMSHELRTPLNAILGFGQLAELDANTSAQKESAEHILRAGRHLLSLINEVLDITGIESGNLRLSSEPVRVSEVVTESLELMAPLAAARSIRLKHDASVRNDIFVHADRQRLKQIILNLVANAVKYNRDGGVATISCEVQGDNVRITVNDTGCGIAEEKLPRLFTAFDRLGAEQTGVEGTGLGLALARRLAEAMDGSIGVHSQLNVGSAFWLTLPRTNSQLGHLEAMDDCAPALTVTSVGRTRKILYVEDNLSNLSLVQRILSRRADIEVIPSMQGGLAVELAHMHRPSLVLLDLHLPDMHGEEVLRLLRATPQARDIPVVVLSADATPGQVERLLAAGARAYITKPLEVREFIAVLDGILEVKEAA